MSVSTAYEVLPANARLLRLPEVQQRTGKSRSAIYRGMEYGEFPQSINIGERAVAWLETEINDWISERITASRCNLRIAEAPAPGHLVGAEFHQVRARTSSAQPEQRS